MVNRQVKYVHRRQLSFQKRLLRKSLTWLAVVAVLLVVKVWQNVTIDKINRKNGHLRAQLQTLLQENAILEVKVEELKSMDRITKIANEELGLKNIKVLTLDLASEGGSAK
jgi:cell division protein FtsL